MLLGDFIQKGVHHPQDSHEAVGLVEQPSRIREELSATSTPRSPSRPYLVYVVSIKVKVFWKISTVVAGPGNFIKSYVRFVCDFDSFFLFLHHPRCFHLSQTSEG